MHVNCWVHIFSGSFGSAVEKSFFIYLLVETFLWR